jgi:hypothetical protein
VQTACPCWPGPARPALPAFVPARDAAPGACGGLAGAAAAAARGAELAERARRAGGECAIALFARDWAVGPDRLPRPAAAAAAAGARPAAGAPAGPGRQSAEGVVIEAGAGWDALVHCSRDRLAPLAPQGRE